eukprot:4502738-Pleurochrysis_carterae.AAC.1
MTRLLPCAPTPLENVSGGSDPLPSPPNGASLSNATNGEAARPASIYSSTLRVCFRSSRS